MAETPDPPSPLNALDRYELVAVVVPGYVAIGLAWFIKSPPALTIANINLASAGLLIIAAFAAGHVLQAIATFCEDSFRTCLQRPEMMVSVEVTEMSLVPSFKKIGYEIDAKLGLGAEPWPTWLLGTRGRIMRRRILAFVRKSSASTKILDAIKVNVGLTRGLTVVFAIGAIAEAAALAVVPYHLAKTPFIPVSIPMLYACLVLAGIFFERAYRYVSRYELEIWTSFEQCASPADPSMSKGA